MFAGIVEEIGVITHRRDLPEGIEISIRARMFSEPDCRIGASISVNGACLTIVVLEDGEARFEVGSETLRRTTLATRSVGDVVNLERSLLVGDRIHGHFVLGHVDATGELLERVSEGGTARYRFKLPPSLAPFIVPKGSVTIDGVSLTVGEVAKHSFTVYVIPHTLVATTLGQLSVGDAANIEADCLARYIQARWAVLVEESRL